MLVPPRRPVSDTDRSPFEPWRSGDVWIHPVVGLRIRVERSAAETAGRSLVVVATFPPGTPEPALHLHPNQMERFTVLHGTLRVRDPRRTDDLSTDGRAEIAPGQPHAVWNPHGEPAVARWETTPALLFALAAAGRTDRHGWPRPLQLAVLMAEFRDEVRMGEPAAWIQRLSLPIVRAVGRRRRDLDLRRLVMDRGLQPAAKCVAAPPGDDA